MQTAAKIGLIAGFLLTGSINTLTKKWQFQTCGPTTFPVVGDNPCPAGEKQFHKPWTQNIQMFIGESLLLIIFAAKGPARRKERARAGIATKPPFYLFALPAACDICGTGIGGVGMLYIPASVWQMMRGSLIIFTCFLTRVFLKRKLQAYNWFAVMVSACGLLLVGVSAILDESSGSTGGAASILLGIGLTILGQMFAATQMVVEELYLKVHKAPPEQVVGSEGAWGVFFMIVVLTVMHTIPGHDAGSYENVLDSMHMLSGSSLLLTFVVTYLLSISFFNFFGVMMSGQLSAVHRTINDALRTMIIWFVEVLVFYIGKSERYGTGLQPHSWLQLLGFICLILGSFINHAVIKLPCVDYPPPDAPPPQASNASISSSRQGVSLINTADAGPDDAATED